MPSAAAAPDRAATRATSPVSGARRKPYTSAGRAVGLRLLLAVLCLPLAVCAWFVAAVVSVDDVEWSPGSAVRADEQVRAVPVEAGDPTLVWSVRSYAHQPVCTVTDAVSGRRLALETAPRGHTREAGRTQWFGRDMFVPDSDEVLVTCVGNDRDQLMVEPKPLLPGSLEAAGWAFGPPTFVLLVGVGLAVSGVRRLSSLTT